MAVTIGYSATVRNAMMDSITTAAGASPLIKFYSGTQPATGGTVTTLLATGTCSATMAPASSGGVLTFNAITMAAAASTGTATWARLTTSGGTFVADFSVGASGAAINISPSAAFTSGQASTFSSLTVTEGNP